MTYEEIMHPVVLFLFMCLLIGAALTSDWHKEVRRLAWAGLLLLTYISDKIQ